MDDRLHDIGTAAKGTCEWLLRHETYKNWATCDRGLLWIKGKPGSGKSTLLRYALGKVRAVPNIPEATLILSFFFHGRGAELQRTPLGLFRSLLHQLLRKASSALSDFVSTFQERCDSVGEPGEKWHWHQDELRTFFELSLAKVLESRSVWLFVDALDECGRENALGLIGEFKSLLQELPSTCLQFRICFTCREYPVLDLDCRFEISVHHQNGEDISTYVQAQLSAPHVSKDLLSATIPALITDRASGVFMWARLVVRRVLELELDGEGLKTIEKAIYAVPEDMDELYLGLVQSMDKRSASLKLIQWICLATRPLSLDELRWAMVIKPDFSQRSLQECQSTEDYVSDNDMMKRRVQKLSCGLAEIVLSYQTQVVQFIHQSVKDFFIDKGLSALDDRSKPTGIEQTKADFAVGMAHYEMSRTCIRYLAMKEITQLITQDYDTLASAFPLLIYATTSWIKHAQKCKMSKILQDDLLDYFSWPSEHLIQFWIRVYDILTQEYYFPDRPRKGTIMIHTVSRYGLIRPLQLILERAKEVDFDIDVEGFGGRTPLSYAAEEGHENIIQLLLEKGADVNVADRDGWTPLHHASKIGRVKVVPLLLEKGADVNVADRNGWTPLHHASKVGHVDVVQLLLEKGADVNAADRYGWTVLHHASGNGHVDVVQLLLEKGADVNAADRDGWMPLHDASENGHIKVVQLLLEKGADVNATRVDGWTVLHHASDNGHVEVVQLLLKKGASINVADRYGWKPLHHASDNGHFEVVELLLKKGAKYNSGQQAC